MLRIHRLRTTIEIKLAFRRVGRIHGSSMQTFADIITPQISYEMQTGDGVATRDAHGVRTGSGVEARMHMHGAKYFRGLVSHKNNS